MTVDLVVRGGKVCTPYGFVEASVSVDAGRIVSLTNRASEPEADRVVDAAGNLVLPGMVDMHVHFRDPGHPDREDFETGTRAAAAGGVTTVADMPNTVPPVTSAEVLRRKVEVAAGKAIIDFALVAGAGALGRETLLSLAEAGAAAFKTFMISRFRELAASDAQMLENFRAIAETGLTCLIHAENEDIVAKGIERARALGRLDPMAHAEFRPPIAEDEATLRTLLLAEEARSRVHVCHMTTRRGVEALRWAKARGVRATGETSPTYLLLTVEDLGRLGPYAKTDPPLRDAEHQRRLWEALRDGTLDAVASDHAPYAREEKERGWEDIFEAPSGGVGVETALPLMLESACRGLISLERLVEVYSTNPARILGLYPRKGVIAPGSDGDLVVVDPRREFIVDVENLHSRQRTTAFAGYRGRGAPVLTVVRGEVVMEEGEVTGRPGWGEFLTPGRRGPHKVP